MASAVWACNHLAMVHGKPFQLFSRHVGLGVPSHHCSQDLFIATLAEGCFPTLFCTNGSPPGFPPTCIADLLWAFLAAMSLPVRRQGFSLRLAAGLCIQASPVHVLYVLEVGDDGILLKAATAAGGMLPAILGFTNVTMMSSPGYSHSHENLLGEGERDHDPGYSGVWLECLEPSLKDILRKSTVIQLTSAALRVIRWDASRFLGKGSLRCCLY